MFKITNTDGIVLLELNNEPVNALSQKLVSELSFLVEDLHQSLDLRALIISSSLNNFCAGADLKERVLFTKEQTINTVYGIKILFDKISSLPIPTLSLVNGGCLGGGLELALSCDFRLGTTDSFFVLPETSLGIIPGAGGTQRLPRLIGISRAKEMIFSAEKVNAKKALEWGLINDIVSSDNIDSAVSYINRFKNNSKLSIELSKCAIDSGIDKSLKSGLNLEFKEYVKTIDSKERSDALKRFNKK